MKHEVYQIRLTETERDTVNALGWEQACNSNPRVCAYLDKDDRIVAGEAFRVGMYDHVATIDAKDLEDVFRISNLCIEDNITRHASMHSVSVGDVIVRNGVAFLVADFGFEEL
jgi:hypothetical protein